MVIANESPRNVQEELDVHPLRELGAFFWRHSTMCIQTIVVGEAGCGRCVGVVKARHESVTKGGT